MFRDSFKYYKSRNPAPNLKNVVDFDNLDLNKVRNVKIASSTEDNCEEKFGLTCMKNWKAYELLDVPGLIFIQNPFTAKGQRFWIARCLENYSRKPSESNLDAHNILKNDETWWDMCFSGKTDNRAVKVLPKLRWATMGYHHDWNTKLYSERRKTNVPVELANLILLLAKALNFLEFKAEAVIVNYYRMNSTLAGHTDHSEHNIEAPLFSISFGQTAIFLIGGNTQEAAANALFLKSGDIVVMSGTSRLRLHGVPKILPADLSPWEVDNEDYLDNYECNDSKWNKIKTYISEARININVRQVLKSGQTSL